MPHWLEITLWTIFAAAGCLTVSSLPFVAMRKWQNMVDRKFEREFNEMMRQIDKHLDMAIAEKRERDRVAKDSDIRTPLHGPH
jgi:hypothetical protein